MPGNAGIYGAEPMTVRPPFMVLCQCNTPAEAREREAAAGCSACLKQAAVGLRKAYCPGRRYGLSARAGSFLSFYGKTVFCRREAGSFSKNGSDKAPFNHVACQCRNLLRGLRRILIQPGFNQADAARYEEGIVVIKGL